MPLMLIGMIYLAIWVAVPAYSDPEGITDLKAKLDKSEEKLADIEKRVSNAEKLDMELSQNSDEQKMLLHYLPDKKLNEDVVASLNSIASSSGVAITSVSFKDTKAGTAAPKEDLTVTAKDSLKLNQEMDSPKNIVPKKTLANDFNANLVVVGEYEKIKKFIVSLAAFKRFNNVEMLSIKANKEDENFLEANIETRFNYLKKLTSIQTIDRDMFKDESFNMSIAKQITDKTNVNITKLGVDSAGRANPFSL